MRPKDTVFLHIGMHKTATTSIQHSLKTYNDGVTRYARLGRPNHSQLLTSVFSAATTTRRDRNRAGADSSPPALQTDSIANRDRLQAQIDTPERNLILSAEGLAVLSQSEVGQLHQFFKPRCSRVHLIAYVRDPVSFASSAYQQRIRSGQSDFALPAPEYRRRFGAYLNIFGPGAIDFVRFAPEDFPDHCIITDFSNRTSLDIGQVNKHRGNASLSAEAVALLRVWNRAGDSGFGSHARLAARSRMIACLGRMFPGTFRFDPAPVRAALDHDDCRWMEEQGGFALADGEQDTSETDISSSQDLRDLCHSAAPVLYQMLQDQGVRPAHKGPVAVMNHLYHALLADLDLDL